ncbi:MAG: AraC family transcriptional regulator [Defluviitaleaceae bacterium]|nr:AraC family transcriptional regulator [Defluviitaleaceae bacterium]
MNVCHIAAWVEINIRRKVDYTKMEKVIGYSYHHIRDFFKQATAISLSRYILARQVANAAFEIRHSKKTISMIADELDFSNIDTFTRVFTRVTDLTPVQFKKSDFDCGRQIICPGVYAPVILDHPNPMFTLQHLKEVNAMSEMKKTADSCILYGVPKVYAGREADGDKQTLPFPMCVQSVLNYMGQNISYAELVAYSGEAFRQRWECNGWSPAAIDPRFIYERPLEAYERAFNGAGRKFTLSVDSEDKKAIIKDDAIALIKAELDCGRPVLALGVVGPPEACIITGYKDGGETVLGWSMFQDSPWNNGCETDETGYFIKKEWWNSTEGIIAIGEEIGERTPDLQVLENALRLMTAEHISTYDGTYPIYGSQKAYEMWAQALETDDFNLGGAQMGHKDAERMAGEGRHYAAIYMEIFAAKHPNLSATANACAKIFKTISDCIHKITKLRETQGLENKNARTQMARLIRQAAKHESDACAILVDIIAQIGGYCREGTAMYNEEEFFAYLADNKRSNVHEYSRYLDELFSLANGALLTHETISAFMDNVRKKGGGLGIGATNIAHKALSDYADYTASTGNHEFAYAFEQYVRKAFEEPVRKKMGEFKSNIAYIPADTKIHPDILKQCGLTNEQYVSAFRVLQEKVYAMYETIEATSPFEWGFPGLGHLTVGGIRYDRILMTLNCLAHYNELEADTLVVCKDSFFMWDWNKTNKTASKNTLKKMATFGFVLDGLDDVKAKTFTMSCPGHPHVMRVIFTLNEKIGNEIHYNAVQDPATLPLPSTFKGIFTHGIMKYQGIEHDDWYGYTFKGKRIARIRWDNTEKSLRLWLKNVLKEKAFAKEIDALPKVIKSKFKPRNARKPCPCGECYKDERNETVIEYPFEGNWYEKCEQRSFIFKNLDVQHIPICLHLLELEYGLVLTQE